MNYTKVSATFIGKNGSMGFRTGKRYEFIVVSNPAIRGMDLFITDNCRMPENASYRIPYQSIHTFLRNWNLVVLEDPLTADNQNTGLLLSQPMMRVRPIIPEDFKDLEEDS